MDDLPIMVSYPSPYCSRPSRFCDSCQPSACNLAEVYSQQEAVSIVGGRLNLPVLGFHSEPVAIALSGARTPRGLVEPVVVLSCYIRWAAVAEPLLS